MRKSIGIFASLCFLVLTVNTFADDFSDLIKYFRAETKTDKVIIKWLSINEKDIDYYIVQRSMDSQNYQDKKKLSTAGVNKEYNYIDDSLFKADFRIYYYRLKVVKTDGSSFLSSPVKIIPKISGIRQTWGTIKAIFE